VSKPKIILFDLETLPNLPEALKVWPQLSNYPGLTLRATITSIICAGWKEYESGRTHCINAWDFPAWKRDVNNDKHVVKALYEVLKDADAIVTHHGKKFDLPHLQTRLKKHKLNSLHNIPHIDTKQTASRHLYSFNNRLGYLGEQFVGDKKLDHEGWPLWVKVHGRDPKAMDKITRYCKQDVKLLEKIFHDMRPLITNIPNYNLWRDKDVCPTCGGEKMKSHGWKHNKVADSYKRLMCLSCGSVCRVDAKGRKPRSM